MKNKKTKNKKNKVPGKNKDNPIIVSHGAVDIPQKTSVGYVFMGDDGLWYSITVKMKKFADLFIQYSYQGVVAPAREAYKKAYSSNNADTTASNAASKLLRSQAVATYIRVRLDSEVMTPEQVDVELSRVIAQYSDLSSKVGAIKEYNRVRNRVKGNVEVTIDQDTKDALERIGKLLG